MLPLQELLAKLPQGPDAVRPVIGNLDTLNCGMGDLKVSFNSDNPDEVAAAKHMVETLLKQGCMIIIKHGDAREERVHAFDPATNEYIVKDYTHAAAAEVPQTDTQSATAAETKVTPAKPRKGKSKRVPAKDVNATAIAPRSGG